MKFVFSYRGAGARVILAEPCQLVHFPTPALHPISVRRQSRQRLSEFFLAAQRRTASAVKKKLPKENPWEGFSLDSFGSKRAAALLRSRGVEVSTTCPMGQSSTGFGSTLFLACKHFLVCKMTNDFPAEQQIWKTCPPQGIFALQKSLRAGCDGGRGSSSQSMRSPRKEISRGNPFEGFPLGNFFAAARHGASLRS